jgi:hypothetical protein
MKESRFTHEYQSDMLTIRVSREMKIMIAALARDRGIPEGSYAADLFAVALSEEVSRMRKLRGERWFLDLTANEPGVPQRPDVVPRSPRRRAVL